MTCKDYLHLEACKNMLEEMGYTVDGDGENADQRCNDFTDKSRFIELPDGRPGDYVEWDNGAGYKKLYLIRAVLFGVNEVRYSLNDFEPVVDHDHIVRILTREAAEAAINKKEKENAPD